MGREYFVFQRNYYEIVKVLDEKQRLEIYDAICEFALNQNESKIEGLSNALFSLIKPDILKGLIKYKNGVKGGRGKKANTKLNESKGITEIKANEKLTESKEETTSPLKERSKENNKPFVQEETPFFISPTGGKKNDSADKFFSLYPRYAKDRAKMRSDVDYDKLIEEFEKSTYLRSLYTVKQINENYPLIIAGDYRDKEKHVDGVTAGREYMADRERWYSERKHKAQSKADEIIKRFMTDETFKGIEKRLRELVPEMARLELDADKGEIKAKQKLVKLTQEQGRLRQQRLSIIERNGMTEEDLIPQWHCKKCQDSGYQEDGKLCDCYGG
jgi:hypothetical protein